MTPIDAFIETIEDPADQQEAARVLNKYASTDSVRPAHVPWPREDLIILVDFIAWAREIDMEDYAE